MGIQGSGLKDTNVRLRLFMLVLIGVVILGSIMYWRSQLYLNAEYVDLRTGEKIYPDKSILKSKNFQIETQDVSPSVK